MTLGSQFGQWSRRFWKACFLYSLDTFNLTLWPRVNFPIQIIFSFSSLYYFLMLCQWHRWFIFLPEVRLVSGSGQPLWKQTMRCGSSGWKEPVLGQWMNFLLRNTGSNPSSTTLCLELIGCGQLFSFPGHQSRLYRVGVTVPQQVAVGTQWSHIYVCEAALVVGMPTVGVPEILVTFPCLLFGICGR